MIAHLDHAGLSAVHSAVDDERVRRVGPRRGQGLAELLQTRTGRPSNVVFIVGLFHPYSLDKSLPIRRSEQHNIVHVPNYRFTKLQHQHLV